MKVSDITAGARVICRGRSYRRPKVSIVTPTYCRNAEGLLAKCLNSAMAQTFDDLELIVIDDGSSDGSEATIREAAMRDDRIVYVRHDRNCGIPAIRTNEGVILARGDAVCFLFDDNILRPGFVASAWNALELSGADVVFCNVHMLAKDGRDFILGGWPLTLELLRNLNTIPNGGVMVRRSFFDRFGLYDPHILLRRMCDWDLWLRALALGAKFVHLDQTAAVEYGLVSSNSIGNTVPWDVKVAYAYMLDDARMAARSRALTPEAIGEYDVFDCAPVRPYVRDGREWAKLVETVYRPFLKRPGANGFDPASPGNRAASLDVVDGWNADWSLIANRRRYLVVSNSINAWASAWLSALRQQPGAIVLNCPEWQLAAFQPADIDLLVLMDCSAPFVGPQLPAFRAASVPIIYVLGYGEQVSNAVPPALEIRLFERNPHIVDLFGSGIYFPQAGASFGPTRRDGAKALARDTYAVVAAERDADRLALTDHISFPFAGVARNHTPSAVSAGTIVYGAGLAASADRATEIVAAPDAALGAGVRPSWEGLGALMECRPGSRIVVEGDLLEASPLAERVGLAAIAARQSVELVTNGVGLAADESGVSPDAWQDWIGSLALCSQVARYAARARHAAPERLTVGVFLNSQMFSGSEVYGLMLARSLKRAGCRVDILVPEESPYGRDTDVYRVNNWLAHHGMAAAKPAPYRPGAAYLSMASADQSAMTARLSAFVTRQDYDAAVCAGFMPAVAALPEPDFLLFMALFQPSAYRQDELACLRGRVSGIMSDSDWSLRAHRGLVGGPGAVVRAMLPIDPHPSAPPKIPRTEGTIRVAIGGTLQPRKRQREAVEAVGLLRDRGQPVELNIYGYQLDMMSGYLREIDEAIAARELGDLVHCHGLVTMDDIARENDIVLMASTDESLPQTLVDLMRLGLIGVAGLSGGIDELIDDGTTGYLTKDLSPYGLANVLARAIADRARWPAVAQEAAARIAAEYSIERNTTRLLNLMIEGAQIENSPFGRLAAQP